jgi:hypothetical protein
MKLFLWLFIFSAATAAWGASKLPDKPGDDYKIPGIGVGAILGNPTALIAKSYTGGNRGWDGGVNFSSTTTYLFGDYLIHFPNLFKVPNAERWVGYVGFGGQVFLNTSGASNKGGIWSDGSSSFVLGIRVPVGLQWSLKSTPLEFFGEIAPGLSVIPVTTSIIESGLGARFYFK